MINAVCVFNHIAGLYCITITTQHLVLNTRGYRILCMKQCIINAVYTCPFEITLLLEFSVCPSLKVNLGLCLCERETHRKQYVSSSYVLQNAVNND